jgi:hypothetical protein
VRVRAEEIHVLHRAGERAQRLDRVEGKKHAAFVQKRADGFDIDPAAGKKIARRKGDQPRFRRKRSPDQIRRDLAHPDRLKITNPDTTTPQLQPRIHVCRIILAVAEDLVARLPRQAVRKKAQAQRCRTKERDLLGLRADETRGGAARLLDVGEHPAEFLVVFT